MNSIAPSNQLLSQQGLLVIFSASHITSYLKFYIYFFLINIYIYNLYIYKYIYIYLFIFIYSFPCHSKPIKYFVYYIPSFKNVSYHLVIYNHISEIPVKISSFLNMKLASKKFSIQDDFLKDSLKNQKAKTSTMNNPDKCPRLSRNKRSQHI